jgi:adenylate cyclase
MLIADIAVYSRLMDADEERTIVVLKAIRRKLTYPKIAEHCRRSLKTTDDGLPSAVDAARCAVTLRHA